MRQSPVESVDATHMIRCRGVEWPNDREDLQRLDRSFTTAEIFTVTATPLGFALECRPVSPPLLKQYAVAWEEFASATRAIVAESNGTVTGAASLAYHPWNRRAVIAHLYVDRATRGRGIGRALVDNLRTVALSCGARQLWVETQNVNAAAIRFYQNYGFVCCGLDTTLYDPTDVPDETGVFFSFDLDRDADRTQTAV